MLIALVVVSLLLSVAYYLAATDGITDLYRYDVQVQGSVGEETDEVPRWRFNLPETARSPQIRFGGKAFVLAFSIPIFSFVGGTPFMEPLASALFLGGVVITLPLAAYASVRSTGKERERLAESARDAIRRAEGTEGNADGPDTGGRKRLDHARDRYDAEAYEQARDQANAARRQLRIENAIGDLRDLAERVADLGARSSRVEKRIDRAERKLREGSDTDPSMNVRRAAIGLVSALSDVTDTVPAGQDVPLTEDRRSSFADEIRSTDSSELDSAIQTADRAVTAAENTVDKLRSRAEAELDAAEEYVTGAYESVPEAKHDDLQPAVDLFESASAAFDDGRYGAALTRATDAQDAVVAAERIARAAADADEIRGMEADADLQNVDLALSEARTALEDGDYDGARRAGERAVDRVEDARTAVVERELELLGPLEDIDHGEVSALATDARAAAADGDPADAVELAATARTEALDVLPDRATELYEAVDAAAKNGEFETAEARIEELRTLATALEPVAADAGDHAVADGVSRLVDEAIELLDEARKGTQSRAQKRAETAQQARSAAEDRLAAGEYRAAIEAYDRAVDAFEEASEIAEAADGTLADTYADRAADVRADMRDAAEAAVERAYDRLPPERFDARAEAERRAGRAATALDDADYRTVATEAAAAVEAAREGLRTRIDERESSAADLLDDGEFAAADAALDEATAAAEALRDVVGSDDADGTDVESRLADLDRQRSAVTSAAADRVESLESDAAAAMARADEAFDDGEYGAAREAYADGRAVYAEAATLADEFDLPVAADLENERVRATRRAGYATLASLSEQLQDARETIVADPSAAEDRFAELRSTLADRSFDHESLQERREELRDEALDGWLQARTEVGRERLTRAEALYDDGDRYDALDAYREAATHLAEIAEDARDAGVQPPELLEELQTACEANVDRIDRELAGVSSVRAVDAELRRVGEPGDPLPSAADAADAGSDEPPTQAESDGVAAADTSGHRADGDTTGAPVTERLDLLGEGGNARVWRVRLEDGREAALKVPTWSGTIASRDIERFLDQAETWDRLDDHPNVVTVYDWGIDAEPWLLMEYVPDGTLAERVGEMPAGEALTAVRDVADALVHARGVAHLDLKPENVLLDGDTPKLADWGLAKVAFARGDTDTRLGLSPPYAAPEQIDRTRGDRDERTDIYQLGVTAYELLTGQLPYPPDAPESLEARILAGDPTPPSELADVPPAVDDVVLRAMAPDRDDRYEVPIELRKALESTLETIDPTPDS